ncbi:MAG: hypothetical protein K9N09_11475 [Candidatus Cloacimonetes bacterium]|nr:hypothetical protein [Candidatus Cloacimonadota bacterium]MCF7869304.1 hypothetical protein [Candidatus Cloacimonadota bacterium]
MGWNLPLPLKYLVDLVSLNNQMNIEGDPTTINYGMFVAETWRMLIFNWKSFLQVVVSGALFAAATLIYNSKEVK